MLFSPLKEKSVLAIALMQLIWRYLYFCKGPDLFLKLKFAGSVCDIGESLGCRVSGYLVCISK